MKFKIFLASVSFVIIMSLIGSTIVGSENQTLSQAPIASDVEDNDTYSTADFISTGVLYTDGISDDADWYTFFAFAGDNIEIVVLFTDAIADIDIRLRGTDGTTILDSAVSTTDNEYIFYGSVATSGSYYLEVFQLSYTTNTYYYIVNIISDDYHEDDDDPTEAYGAWDTASWEDLVLLDDDCFNVSYSSSGAFSCLVEYEYAGSMVTIDLYDQNGQLALTESDSDVDGDVLLVGNVNIFNYESIEVTFVVSSLISTYYFYNITFDFAYDDYCEENDDEQFAYDLTGYYQFDGILYDVDCFNYTYYQDGYALAELTYTYDSINTITLAAYYNGVLIDSDTDSNTDGIVEVLFYVEDAVLDYEGMDILFMIFSLSSYDEYSLSFDFLADSDEDNDIALDATLIPNFSSVGLMFFMDDEDETCLSWDQDWYFYPGLIGDQIQITINFTHALGDIDLYIYEDDATTLLDSSTGVSDEEVCLVTMAYDGMIYIQVGGDLNGNEYDLLIELVAVTDDDTFEENDNPTQSKAVTTGTTVDLVSNDLDYYNISITTGKLVTIGIVYESDWSGLIDPVEMVIMVSGPVSFEIYDLDPFLGYSNVTFTAPETGVYVITVMGIFTHMHYNLTVSISDAPPATNPDDKKDDNKDDADDQSEIPGFPVEIIGLVTLLSMISLVSAKKRKNDF